MVTVAATGLHRVRVVRWLIPSLLVVVWLGAGGWLGMVGSNLGDEVTSGAATYLPRNAEATEVAEINKRFGEAQAMPAIVVYSRDAALTEADRRTIADQAAAINRELGSKLTGPATGPVVAPDGRAAILVVPFAGTDSAKIAADVPTVRELGQRR